MILRSSFEPPESSVHECSLHARRDSAVIGQRIGQAGQAKLPGIHQDPAVHDRRPGPRGTTTQQRLDRIGERAGQGNRIEVPGHEVGDRTRCELPSSSSQPRQRADPTVAISSASRAVVAVGPPEKRPSSSAVRASSHNEA